MTHGTASQRKAQDQGFIDSTFLTATPTATLTLWPDLLQISFPGNPQRRGKKQALRGASAKSLNHLRRLLSQVQFKSALWVTLTYHKSEPTTDMVKRDVDVFTKRLSRAFPGASWVWKMELQKRGYWHVHMILFDMPKLSKRSLLNLSLDSRLEVRREKLEMARYYLARRQNRMFKPINWFKDTLWFYRFWVSSIWHEITGETTREHLVCSTNVQVVRSYRALQGYVSKYIAKAEELTAFDKTGRLWGRSNNLSRKPLVIRNMDVEQAMYLRRVLVTIMRQQNDACERYAQALDDAGEIFGVWGVSLLGFGVYSEGINDTKYILSLIKDFLEKQDPFADSTPD